MMNVAFLYSIASIGTAYVGFTSLFIALRDSGSKRVDNLTSWSTRYLIAVALTTVCTALLPIVLVALFDDDMRAIRFSSLAAALFLGRLDAIYIIRRPQVDQHTLDWRLKILLVVAVVIDIAFAIVAAGLMAQSAFAVYLGLELGEILVMFCYFAWALERLLPLRWEVEAP